MESVYLETSFFSYLTANISRNLISAARQQITHEWWENSANKYELCISDFVLVEANNGDLSAAKKRINFIKDNHFQLLPIPDKCVELAEVIFQSIKLPENAKDDALHISIAIYHNIDFLLTWNCRHIANAHFLKKLSRFCFEKNYSLPQICTPAELVED